MNQKTSLKSLIEAEVASGELALPVFNRTALELRQLTQSENTTIDQITAVLKKDQALASRLLMLANSAFYSGLRQVDTVNAAVVRLGTKRVGNLALVAGQSMIHRSDNPAIAARMPGLWTRAFLSSAGCEWLVRHAELDADPEAAFLAGLLHDVGELYLLKTIEKVMADGAAADALTPRLIDEVLEAMHPQVGHDVMLKWGLPEKYARVARDHQLPEFDAADTLLGLCRLLDQACIKLGAGCTPNPEVELEATLEAQVLGLSGIILAQLEIYLEDTMAGIEPLPT